MFGRIMKHAKAERENYLPHFCDSQEPGTQDYQPGTLGPNEPIFIVQAAPQDCQCTPHCSVMSRTLSPMCCICPILNANIIQTSWQ